MALKLCTMSSMADIKCMVINDCHSQKLVIRAPTIVFRNNAIGAIFVLIYCILLRYLLLCKNLIYSGFKRPTTSVSLRCNLSRHWHCFWIKNLTFPMTYTVIFCEWKRKKIITHVWFSSVLFSFISNHLCSLLICMFSIAF